MILQMFFWKEKNHAIDQMIELKYSHGKQLRDEFFGDDDLTTAKWSPDKKWINTVALQRNSSDFTNSNSKNIEISFALLPYNYCISHQKKTCQNNKKAHTNTFSNSPSSHEVSSTNRAPRLTPCATSGPNRFDRHLRFCLHHTSATTKNFKAGINIIPHRVVSPEKSPCTLLPKTHHLFQGWTLHQKPSEFFKPFCPPTRFWVSGTLRDQRSRGPLISRRVWGFVQRCCATRDTLKRTARKFNSEFTPENRPKPKKERIVFQPSFFGGELLNFGGAKPTAKASEWLEVVLSDPPIFLHQLLENCLCLNPGLVQPVVYKILNFLW